MANDPALALTMQPRFLPRVLRPSPLVSLASSLWLTSLLVACNRSDRPGNTAKDAGDGAANLGDEGDDGPDEHDDGEGVTGWEAEGGEEDDDDEDEGDSAETATQDPDVDLPRFDLGTLPDHDPPLETGCGKVDFLFVIDNSGSMGDEQQNLKRNFPRFIESIEQTLDLDDFHVMAVDTDAGAAGNSSCFNGNCTCTPADTCCFAVCQNPSSQTCNSQSCDDLDTKDCNVVLGAGRVTNSETNRDCKLEGPGRFVTNRDMDTSRAFTCAASVGIGGDTTERQMAAMLAAVSPELVSNDGCNAGFLRDDAILVVTVITDEAEDPSEGQSPGDPASWKADLVAAKGGDESSIVVLGLIGDRDLPNPLCNDPDQAGGGAEASPRLRAFVRSFEHGLDASVCEPDYQPFFDEAVGIIDTVCKDFDPPGR